MEENGTVPQDQPPSQPNTTTPQSHALIIGGTGMLRETSLALATRFDLVSVIARNSNRLNDLWEEALQAGLRINPLQLDYKDEEHLQLCLEDLQKEFGPVQTVVAWIKSNAEEANAIIANYLNQQTVPVDYFDVLGSLHYKDFEVDEEEREELYGQFPNVKYHQVKLGLKQDDNDDEPRWLTYEEITEGIVAAIDQKSDEYLIGDSDVSHF